MFRVITYLKPYNLFCRNKITRYATIKLKTGDFSCWNYALHLLPSRGFHLLYTTLITILWSDCFALSLLFTLIWIESGSTSTGIYSHKSSNNEYTQNDTWLIILCCRFWISFWNCIKVMYLTKKAQLLMITRPHWLHLKKLHCLYLSWSYQ